MTLGKRHPFCCFPLQSSLSQSPNPIPTTMHPQNTGRSKMGHKAQELDFPGVGESPAVPTSLEAEFQSPLGPWRACSPGVQILCHTHPLTLSSHLTRHAAAMPTTPQCLPGAQASHSPTQLPTGVCQIKCTHPRLQITIWPHRTFSFLPCSGNPPSQGCRQSPQTCP